MKKVVKALREGGVPLLFQRIFNKAHNLVRPVLPRREFRKAGLKFRGRLGDYHNSSQAVTGEQWKWEARHAVEEYVNGTDNAVVIGAGEGLTATHMARNADYVHVFEPAYEMIEKTKETLELNTCTDLTIHPGVFGGTDEEDEKIWGSFHPFAYEADGSDIPECDVLELDCEGVELQILKELQVRPRVLIVEVHEVFGVSFQEVRQLVENMGYSIELVYPQNRDDGTSNFVATREVKGS